MMFFGCPIAMFVAVCWTNELRFEKENEMKTYRARKSLLILAVALAAVFSAHAADNAPATAPVQKTVSVRVLGDNKRMPEVNLEDVTVKQGKTELQVTNWTPARGDRAGLELFILIDDAADSSFANQINEIRSFVTAQPETTSVGVGYMRNGTVQIAQNLTKDRNQAANSVRLTLGSVGAFGSPYLSVMDLMKRWPSSDNRHEVIMITDGIDRAGRTRVYRGLLDISPDVNSASLVAQKSGTIIHSIYTHGVGRRGRNFWEITNGQTSIARLSDETGGESYFLGTASPVSMKPYLDDLQTTLDNQYLIEFHAVSGKKSK
jgi:hypothetical protein